jgi:hypothetical protein
MSRRLTLRQRGWSPYSIVRTFGPFTGVTATGLRVALVGLHQSDRSQPAVCGLDRQNNRWIEYAPAEFAARVRPMVTEMSGSADALTHAMISIDAGDRPVVLGVCERFVSIKSNHTVGDGNTILRLLSRLIEGATSASPAPPARPGTRAPLTRAAMRFYAADPRRVVRTLTVERPASAMASPATLPWHAQPTFAFARSDDGLVARLRAWRDAHAPGASIAAVVTAATCAALARAGLAVDDTGMYMLVDARRYLPADTVVRGNFAVGQFLAPADPTSPGDVHAALQAAIDAGRPLSTLAVCDMKTLLGHTVTPDGARRRAADPRIRLSMSHVRSADFLYRLPWDGAGRERRISTVGAPGAPEGMTVNSNEHQGVLHLTASFHATTFAPTAVADAIELVCQRPESVLAS